MGSSIFKIWSKLIGQKEVNLIMFGLDSVGKTTILYSLNKKNAFRIEFISWVLSREMEL